VINRTLLTLKYLLDLSSLSTEWVGIAEQVSSWWSLLLSACSLRLVGSSGSSHVWWHLLLLIWVHWTPLATWMLLAHLVWWSSALHVWILSWMSTTLSHTRVVRVHLLTSWSWSALSLSWISTLSTRSSGAWCTSVISPDGSFKLVINT
jgi:hypothetical protein